MSLKCGNASITTYVQQAKAYSDQLAALGSPVAEEDLIHYITEGLGPAYWPFTRALEARIDSISFDNLYGLLLSEELQLARDESSLDSLNASANYSQRGGRGCGNRGRGRGRFTSNSSKSFFGSINMDITCYNCRGYGHTSKQCPSGKSSPSSNVAFKNRVDHRKTGLWIQAHLII